MHNTEYHSTMRRIAVVVIVLSITWIGYNMLTLLT